MPAMIKVQTLGVGWREIQNHHISFWLRGRFRSVFSLQVHSFNIFLAINSTDNYNNTSMS